jgi:hypothetical protein
LYDPALVHPDDHVATLDGAFAVADDDDGSTALLEVVQSAKDGFLGFTVESVGCFV